MFVIKIKDLYGNQFVFENKDIIYELKDVDHLGL